MNCELLSFKLEVTTADITTKVGKRMLELSVSELKSCL
jgi:hypothetical protein